MFRSIHRKCKKTLCLGAVALMTGTACFALTGCETNRPEVRITLSFNEQTYVLDYTLYRNLYPQTVRHFLELADANYYDGLCVHNYTSTAMYMGGYTYTEGGANGGLTEKNYFEAVKDLNLSQSVFDQATGECVNTLYGEFAENGYKVENNAQKHSYGSLVMYYTPKGDDMTRVKTKRSSDGEIDENKTYQYNSATSLFYVFTGSSSTMNDSYCTFGQLADDDASDVLEALEEAIDDYIDSLGDESFTEEVNLWIDTFDPYVASAKNTAYYEVPVLPIVIESVEVVKY